MNRNVIRSGKYLTELQINQCTASRHRYASLLLRSVYVGGGRKAGMMNDERNWDSLSHKSSKVGISGRFLGFAHQMNNA